MMAVDGAAVVMMVVVGNAVGAKYVTDLERECTGMTVIKIVGTNGQSRSITHIGKYFNI